MQAMELERAYRNLVARDAGTVRARKKDTRERRRHPRFPVHTPELTIDDLPEFRVRDVSAAGIGLTADFPLSEGDRVTVRLRDDLNAKAVVSHCKLVDCGRESWAPLFYVGCCFQDEVAGMALVVTTKELEQEMLAQALA